MKKRELKIGDTIPIRKESKSYLDFLREQVDGIDSTLRNLGVMRNSVGRKMFAYINEAYPETKGWEVIINWKAGKIELLRKQLKGDAQ